MEAGRAQGWRGYVGDGGDVIGLDRFGASAPGEVVIEHLGFTVARVVERARVLVRPKGRTRRQVRDYQRTARR